MVAKRKACGCGRKKRGGALRQSGNGIFSNFLPAPLSNMASMVGLGRRPQYGRGAWGDMLSNIIHTAGQKGIADLGNLARKL